MDPSRPSYTLLRIKRKATDQPLSSLGLSFPFPLLSPDVTDNKNNLVIETESNPGTPGLGPGQGREKRRQISGRPRGIFRLAETVDESWKGRGEEAEGLRVCFCS
jgi:hypothetical protein